MSDEDIGRGVSTPTEETFEERKAESSGDQSVSSKAKEVQESLTDLASTVSEKVKQAGKESVRKVKSTSIDLPAQVDSTDIRYLDKHADALAAQFENMMSGIRKETYDAQITLFTAYRDLLQEWIKLVSARMVLAKTLKPGA